MHGEKIACAHLRLYRKAFVQRKWVKTPENLCTLQRYPKRRVTVQSYVFCGLQEGWGKVLTEKKILKNQLAACIIIVTPPWLLTVGVWAQGSTTATSGLPEPQRSSSTPRAAAEGAETCFTSASLQDSAVTYQLTLLWGALTTGTFHAVPLCKSWVQNNRTHNSGCKGLGNGNWLCAIRELRLLTLLF